MAKDEIAMAVREMLGYHVTRSEPKCSLEWMASCFVIPPSLKCRYLGTWDEILEDNHRLDNDLESFIPKPKILTHAELHSDTPSRDYSPYSQEPEQKDDNRHEDNYFQKELSDPIDDYLSQYANMLSSKDHESDELESPTTQDRSPEERSHTFVRRKSCPNVSSRSGLSLSLSLPKEESAVDDMKTRGGTTASHSKHGKPETSDLKNITAIARRMSIPILDKSEDVDHGTKTFAETMIKKNKSIKQFREAFSEETDDYIPHRHARTVTQSLTENEIEKACDELKNEKPGSYKNIIQEIKLRGQDYNESHQRKYAEDESQNAFSKPETPTTHEFEHSNEHKEIRSPSNYNFVLQELKHLKDDKMTPSHVSNESRNHNPMASSLTNSYNDSVFDSSATNKVMTNTLPRQKPLKHRQEGYLNDEKFSKTLPADFGGNMSGASTPRSCKSETSHRNNTSKQKSEEPVSDLMKKLNNLTAQTRLATRPSLGNVEGYMPASTMTRSQSVMHVSSPLSPKYDRGLLSSSFSSSTSSSSDIPSISYHDVVDPCHRCWKTVYSMDKIGPIRRVLYHKQCFRCAKCNTMLSLNTYRQNVNDKSDVQVYCKKHVPSQASPHIGLEAKNLSVVMNHPKLDNVNQNIRGTVDDRRKSMNLHPLIVGRAISTPRLDLICGPSDNSRKDSAPEVDKNGNVSLRELKMDEQPKSVWSRSSFSAAKLDLNVPASGRKGSSLYRTADSWNYL